MAINKKRSDKKMKEHIQEIKIQMQKELNSYKASTKNAKLYFTSMQEVSSWLNEKEK